MSRYIDADAYIKYCDEHWIPLNVDAVKAQPTADVVVHGEWIEESDRHHHCSVCGEDALCKEDWQFLDCVEILSDYCPNCGARMEGKK